MQVEGKIVGLVETGPEGMVWALERGEVAGYDDLFILEEKSPCD